MKQAAWPAALKEAARWAGLVLGLCGLLALGGCGPEAANEPGVVAVVNGAPITAAELEARHDLGRLGLPEAGNPAVERLRAEYGAVLADMIVARLVRQELARLSLAVTDAELAAAENAVRADYPDAAFDRLLLEERIDLARWREALADHLAMAKFGREVLRRNVRVGVAEAADYYKEHIADFTRAARVRLLLVRGPDAGTVKAALAAAPKPLSPAALSGQAGVSVQELTLADRNLPLPWREALKKSGPGEASSVLAADSDAEALVLLERLPETVLDPAKAYAQVEARLAAQKLDQAFDAWLAEALDTAKIRVSGRLATAPVPPAEAVRTEPASEQVQVRDVVSDQAGQAMKPRPDGQTGPDAQAPAPATVAVVQSPEAVAAPPGQDPVPPVAAEATAEPAAVAASPEPAPTGAPEGKSVPLEAAVLPAAEPAAPQGEPAVAAGAGGEVEFSAVKASWILYTVDEGQEERVYLKPGQPVRLAFTRRLSVRLGSPSEVAYRFGGKETIVEVGRKESRVLEFP